MLPIRSLQTLYCSARSLQYFYRCRQVNWLSLQLYGTFCVQFRECNQAKRWTNASQNVLQRVFSTNTLPRTSHVKLCEKYYTRWFIGEKHVKCCNRFYGDIPNKDITSREEIRNFTSASAGPEKPVGNKGAAKQPSLYERFKTLWKQYWYVLLPVHFVTSLGWFGSFYFLSLSGVDIIGILERLGVSESIVNRIRKAPQAGHLAIAYALYHITTPIRYAATLGATHVAIKFLVRRDWIQPVPSRARIKEIIDHRWKLYNERYEQFRASVHNRRSARKKKM